MRRLRGAVALACLLCLLHCNVVRSESEEDIPHHDLNGVCVNGRWIEESETDLMTGKKLPLAQCWRKPVCLNSQYALPHRCAERKLIEDWPTWDPHLKDSPQLHSFSDLAERFFKGSSVIFTGDSVNTQVFQAAVCEAAKFYPLTHVTQYLSGPPQDDPKWAEKFSSFFYNLHTLTHQDLTEPGSIWKGGPVIATEIINHTRTLISRKGWHRFYRQDMESQMRLADILIVNYGIHYATDPFTYEKHLEELYPMLEHFSSQPGKIAIFRETSADHAPYRIGHPSAVDLEAAAARGPERFDAEAEMALPETARGCRCAPTDEKRNATAKYRQMNQILHKVAKRYPRVGLLQWEDLTAQRHDMHEGSFCAFQELHASQGRSTAPTKCCECVHFCYTPLFWKHVFSRLYDELARLRFKPGVPENPPEEAPAENPDGEAAAGVAEGDGGGHHGEAQHGAGNDARPAAEAGLLRARPALNRAERREEMKRRLAAGGAGLDG